MVPGLSRKYDPVQLRWEPLYNWKIRLIKFSSADLQKKAKYNQETIKMPVVISGEKSKSYASIST